MFFIGIWGTAAYTFHATPTQLALMMGVSSLCAIVGSVIAGVLIDRFGPRRVLIAAEILSIPAVIWLMSSHSLPLFTLANGAFALVGVPTFTAGASFAPYLVKTPAELERANAYIEAAGSSAFVLGPAVGALVVRQAGTQAVFLVMIVASVVAAALAWLVRIEVAPRAHEAKHPLAELTEGLRLSYGTRSLRFYILAGTVVWLGFGAFSALEPLFYRDVVRAGVEWIGYMNTAFGIGMVAGAALLPRLPSRVMTARGLAVAAIFTGLGAILYVGSTDLRLIAGGALVWGLVIGLTEPLLRTLIHMDSPHSHVGRIVGTAQYHKNAGELVPLAVAPWLAAAFGVQPVLIGGGVLVALIALLALPAAGSIDAEREARADELARCVTQEG